MNFVRARVLNHWKPCLCPVLSHSGYRKIHSLCRWAENEIIASLLITSVELSSLVWTNFSLFKDEWRQKKSFSGGSGVKNPPANASNAGDTGSISGSGRSPGGGNGNLHSSILFSFLFDMRLFLPGRSHGQSSLAAYSPWDHKNQTQLNNWARTQR